MSFSVGTANAGYFTHEMDGRVRELRLERGERIGREHFGREFRSEGRFDSRREFRPGEGRWFHDFRESGFALKR